jgi:hypothetical protein
MKLHRLRQKVSNFWYEQISTRLFPRQRWLTSRIPRWYVDVPEIIDLVLYESLINYWENDGEESLRHQYEAFHIGDESLSKAGWSEEDIKKEHDKNYECYCTLLEAYQWARERKVLRVDINRVISHFRKTKEVKKVYNWFNTIEEHILKEDDRHLQNIVKYRAYLWT